MKCNFHTSPFSFCNLDFMDKQQLVSFVFLNSESCKTSFQFSVYYLPNIHKFQYKNTPQVILSLQEN